MRIAWWAFLTALAAFPAWAGPPRLEGPQQKIELSTPGGGKKVFQRLLAEESIYFTATGPQSVAFRLCQLRRADQPLVPLYITVIRDQLQQGTVRGLMQPEPARQGQGGLLCSAELLLLVAVPPGKHSYQMLVSGNQEGVALLPTEEIGESDTVLEATPAGDQPAVLKRRPRPIRPGQPPPPPPSRPLATEVELLDTPPAAASSAPPRTFVLREPSPSRGARRVLTGLAGMFMVSTVACLVSAGALEYQAHQEPVQLDAGRLRGQARRAWEASAVMGALAGVAVVAAISLVWQGKLAGEEGWGIFRF